MSALHIRYFIRIPVSIYIYYAHQYKSRVEIFSRYALYGGPEKAFSTGPETALGGPA
jgi:hypothetical protein